MASLARKVMQPYGAADKVDGFVPDHSVDFSRELDDPDRPATARADQLTRNPRGSHKLPFEYLDPLDLSLARLLTESRSNHTRGPAPVLRNSASTLSPQRCSRREYGRIPDVPWRKGGLDPAQALERRQAASGGTGSRKDTYTFRYIHWLINATQPSGHPALPGARPGEGKRGNPVHILNQGRGLYLWGAGEPTSEAIPMPVFLLPIKEAFLKREKKSRRRAAGWRAEPFCACWLHIHESNLGCVFVTSCAAQVWPGRS